MTKQEWEWKGNWSGHSNSFCAYIFKVHPDNRSTFEEEYYDDEEIGYGDGDNVFQELRKLRGTGIWIIIGEQFDDSLTLNKLKRQSGVKKYKLVLEALETKIFSEGFDPGYQGFSYDDDEQSYSPMKFLIEQLAIHTKRRQELIKFVTKQKIGEGYRFEVLKCLSYKELEILIFSPEDFQLNEHRFKLIEDLKSKTLEK